MIQALSERRAVVEGIDDSIHSRTGQPLLRFPNPESRIPASLPHRQHRDLLAIVIQLLGAHDQ
ncbi:hypothetical protein XAP6164_1780002 [Xanthomonas phaseoli pv. phaseoli]|nr:hypothetical protein XAP6164_1780002 [Xanthomonas phaseoli pv. phaseoli]